MEVYKATLIEKKDEDGNTQNFTLSFSRQYFETLKTATVDLIETLSCVILMFSFNFNNALQLPLSVIPSQQLRAGYQYQNVEKSTEKDKNYPYGCPPPPKKNLKKVKHVCNILFFSLMTSIVKLQESNCWFS